MQDSDPAHESQEHIDAHNSQGFLYRPSGPVEQVFGDQIAGDKIAGDKVLGDKILIEAEIAYDVRGLPNPYLGLRAFTYADRAAFAGREALVEESVARITAPGDPQSLTFITGASGSGKSSFAQAGLLPALEEHYRARSKTARWAVFRPGSNPLAALADALLLLGLPEIAAADLTALTPQQFADFLSRHTPPDQVNFLVIDQFEETFTQAQPDQGKHLIALLSEPPPFSSAQTHLIATLRSDYLDWLFEEEALWDRAARSGIGLRAMDERQLKAAILKPLQSAAQIDSSLKGKQIEPALVDKLAADASADAAYLPLLQVTLQDLWDRGLLKLSEYAGLAEAISHRAERVYRFSDFEAAQLSHERPAADQEHILSIFLDLVNVSLDDDPRRDVRRWLVRHDFERVSPDRPPLVEQLLHARLLSLQVEGQGKSEVERLSIIHEALIARWDRLKEAIQTSRNKLRRRARFELDLNEWQNQGGDLLGGGRLADALALLNENDPIVQSESARRFLKLSQDRFAAEQRRIIFDHLRNSALRGLVGGALGFGLAFLLAYLPQVEDLFTLVVGAIFMAASGAVAGLVFCLGIDVLRARNLGWSAWLLAGLLGAFAFSIPLLVNTILLTAQLGLIDTLLAVFQGGLWGFAAGIGAWWASGSRRYSWQGLAGASLFGGLALFLGQMVGQALTLPDRTRIGAPSEALPGGLIFLAGAIAPLVLLLLDSLSDSENSAVSLLQSRNS